MGRGGSSFRTPPTPLELSREWAYEFSLNPYFVVIRSIRPSVPGPEPRVPGIRTENPRFTPSVVVGSRNKAARWVRLSSKVIDVRPQTFAKSFGLAIGNLAAFSIFDLRFSARLPRAEARFPRFGMPRLRP